MNLINAFLDWVTGDTAINDEAARLRSGEHIDEVWNIHGQKVYHVENAHNGREWTSDRNVAPHCGHRAGAGLTEMTPPIDYQHITARTYDDNAAEIADGWNGEQGHYEGQTYHHSAAEIAEEMSKL